MLRTCFPAFPPYYGNNGTAQWHLPFIQRKFKSLTDIKKYFKILINGKNATFVSLSPILLVIRKAFWEMFIALGLKCESVLRAIQPEHLPLPLHPNKNRDTLTPMLEHAKWRGRAKDWSAPRDVWASLSYFVLTVNNWTSCRENIPIKYLE